MRLRVTAWGMLLLGVLAGGCGGKQSQPKFDAEAARILERAGTFYQQQGGYRVQSRLATTVADRHGQRMSDFEPMVNPRTIVVQSSGEYALVDNEFRLACDGTWLRINPTAPPPDARAGTPPLNRYWRTAAPEKPADLAGLTAVRLFGGSPGVGMLFLLKPGLKELLNSENDPVGTLGETTIGDRPAHHLVIRASESSDSSSMTEVWIAAEGDPLLLQVRHTPPPQRIKSSQGERTGSIITTETFEDWKFGQEEPPETFAAPEDALRVAELAQLVRAPSPLLGQPAPRFELPLLDGGRVSQAALQSEQKVVMLDFWATWCGPCRMELPIVARLAQEFAANGVVLYAVNQQESAQSVAAFQREQKFQFTAALDPEGELSRTFGAGSLPFLCMLGRDGTIQAVHVGVGDDTEAAIREELAALITGRDIATEGLPE